MQDQIHEVFLKSNWKIQDVAEELSANVTQNVLKKVLMKNTQTNMGWVTDEGLLSRITKMMQIPPLDRKKDVQQKVKEKKSKQSKDDKRKKYQLDADNPMAELLSSSDTATDRSAFKKDFKIWGFFGEEEQKEKLSYISLLKQTEEWQKKGYSNK